MRRASFIIVPMLLATAACSGHKDEKAAANAMAPAGFVPPTALNRTDFVGILDKHFTQYDLNHDSVLEASEVPARHHDRIMSFDANHDGKITLDEFEKGGLARFDEADGNHDQVLTGQERRAALGSDMDDSSVANQSSATG